MVLTKDTNLAEAACLTALNPEVHAGEALGRPGVAAKQAMLAKDPKVRPSGLPAQPQRSTCGSSSSSWMAGAVQKGIDFADLEAANLKTDFRRELQDLR